MKGWSHSSEYTRVTTLIRPLLPINNFRFTGRRPGCFSALRQAGRRGTSALVGGGLAPAARRAAGSRRPAAGGQQQHWDAQTIRPGLGVVRVEEAAGQTTRGRGQHQQLRGLLCTKLVEAFEDIGFGQQLGPGGGNLRASRAQDFFQRGRAHGGGLVKLVLVKRLVQKSSE